MTTENHNSSQAPGVQTGGRDSAAARAMRFVPAITRTKVIESLKTLAWVVPLTLLIWIYAEREQTAKATVTVPVLLVSDAPDRGVTFRDHDQDSNIVLELEGPRVGIERFMDEVLPGRKAGGKGIELVIQTQPIKADHDVITIPVRDRLNAHPLLRKNAVTLGRCLPTYLRVVVDRLASRTLAVAASDKDIAQLGKVSIKAEPVKVRAPRLAFEDAERNGQNMRDGKLVLFADLQSLYGRSPGTYEVQVPLEFPGSDTLVEMPKTVMATVEIIATKYSIPQVKILVLAAPSLLKDYSVEIDSVLQDVMVVGPAKQIASLKPDLPPESRFVPEAHIRVTPQDVLGDGPHDRELKSEDFRLPPDVTLAEGAKCKVTFRLVRK